MNIAKLFLDAVVIIYGCLSIFGAFIQMKKNKAAGASDLLMILGAIMIIASVVFKVQLVFLLIAGLILIHVSAICNGLRMFGKIHYKHHVIRAAITLVIVISYVMLNYGFL